MKKIVSRGACLLFALCLSLNAVGCQKSNENNKIKEGQSISSEEAGMSINANGKNETFKPSDYTLEAKKEYVYEYLGLKFKLSDKFRNYIADKKIAMLDDQSPIDKELKYAILTFEKMTEEQKNAVIEKMGDGCTTQFQRKGKTVLRICFLIILKPLIQMVDAVAISANNIYIRQSGKIAFLLNAYIDICKSIKLSGG